MRLRLLTVVLVLGTGCGRLAVETRPMDSGSGPVTEAPRATPERAIRPTPLRAPAAAQVVRDSAADVAALESLQAAIPDSLPELNIETPTFDLNVADYVDHPRVRYYLDYFSGRGSERFQIWLDRMPRFEANARERLTERGLPGDLVYLALIESGFSTVAVSSAKAVGMWQFMPATGKGYGLRIDGWVDERRDPIKATDAAARHLRDLTERFGSYYLAAAAYNAGAGRVGRSLDRMNATMGQGDEPLDLSSDEAFFSLADTRLIVQETRDYVPKLIAATLIAKSPEQYGFRQPEAVEPFPRDSVILMGGTGLDLIARLADTSLDAVRELNPHVLRLVTPPGGTYAIRVPAGSAESIMARYLKVPENERAAITTHRVKSGETIASVAKRYGVTSALVSSTNGLSRRSRLRAGATLVIPVSNTLPASALAAIAPAVTGTSTRTHIVRRGETLGGIANRYGVSQASLRSINRLSASGAIRSGQKLTIQRTTTTSSASTRALSANPKTHTVRSGETVSEIAEKYGVGLSSLLSANRLGKSGKIRVGQKLRLP